MTPRQEILHHCAVIKLLARMGYRTPEMKRDYYQFTAILYYAEINGTVTIDGEAI